MMLKSPLLWFFLRRIIVYILDLLLIDSTHTVSSRLKHMHLPFEDNKEQLIKTKQAMAGLGKKERQKNQVNRARRRRKNLNIWKQENQNTLTRKLARKLKRKLKWMLQKKKKTPSF